MQSNIILTLYTTLIWISLSHGSNYQFTTNNKATGDVICDPNQNCHVSCSGTVSCYSTTSGSRHTLYGPAGYALTIDVDSGVAQGYGVHVLTFVMKIECKDCSSLTINVPGAGQFEFYPGEIVTPKNGLTTLDCNGPPLAQSSIASGYEACNTIRFKGENGFGTGVGQVNVIDVSNTPGRFNLARIRYNCIGAITDECLGVKWGPDGYLQCNGPLACMWYAY